MSYDARARPHMRDCDGQPPRQTVAIARREAFDHLLLNLVWILYRVPGTGYRVQKYRSKFKQVLFGQKERSSLAS